jgi:hypothetical protein
MDYFSFASSHASGGAGYIIRPPCIVRPLPAIRIAGRYARLSGIEAGLLHGPHEPQEFDLDLQGVERPAKLGQGPGIELLKFE